MERLLRLTKAAIIGGALVVLPVVLTLLVIRQAWALARRLLDPLGSALDLDRLSLLAADLLAALLLLLACLAIGLVVQTRLGGRARSALEARLLDRLPAYAEIKAIARSGAGMEGARYRSVLVDVHGVDAWAPALLIEPETDGRATVYVPAAPAVSVGFVHVVPAARVREIDAGLARVAGVVRQFGVGARALAAEAHDAFAGRASGASERDRRDRQAEDDVRRGMT